MLIVAAWLNMRRNFKTIEHKENISNGVERMLEQKIQLRTKTNTSNAVVDMVQNDTGRILVAHLPDFELISGDTASLFCVRPSGSRSAYSGTINTAAQTVTIAINASGGALTESGKVAAELMITRNGNVVSTFRFVIRVEESTGYSPTS